jgi:hypothetical protein
MRKCSGVCGVVRVVATLGPNVYSVVMMTRLADFACEDWS